MITSRLKTTAALLILASLAFTTFGILTLPNAASAQPVNQTSTAQAPATPTATTPAAGKDCSILSPSTYFSQCIWIPLMSWLGSWFLTLGGYVLKLAGLLFDTLIFHIIVQFKETLQTLSITDAVNTGWTIFRDLSNILIIGMFTFIAIGTILGLEKFGAKRAVAQVLIVAVLINFSLIFTKIIIDGSNFAAFVIYKQMAGGQTASAGSFDIAQAFLRPMGMESVWNDSGKVALAIGKTTNSGFQAFFFGLAGGIMLLAVAAVLLYGCFLILSRAILLIILMLTGPLAFATYLHPDLAHGEYGWSSWWKSLINAAVFGPLLMILLGISLVIITAAGQKGGVPIGNILVDPQKQLAAANGWVTILVYLIGTGMLFVSFRLASRFAGTISGFNFAAMIPAVGLAAGARVAAFAGRQTAGRVGMKVGGAMQKASQDQSKPLWSRQLYDFGAQQSKKIAKQDFNLMRTGLGSAVGGVSGIKADKLAGKPKKGFEGTETKRAEAFAEQAGRMKLTKDEMEEAAKKARNEVLKADPEFAQRHAEATALKESATRQKDSAERNQAAITEEITKAIKPLQETAERLRSAANANPQNVVAQQNAANAEAAVNHERAARDADLQREKVRIESATKTIENADSTLQNIDSELDRAAVRRGLRPEAYKHEDELAAEAANKRFTNILMRAMGMGKPESDRLTKMAAKEVGEHHKKKSATEAMKALQEIAGHEEGHGAPEPTPAHGPAAPTAAPGHTGGATPPAGGGHHP